MLGTRSGRVFPRIPDDVPFHPNNLLVMCAPAHCWIASSFTLKTQNALGLMQVLVMGFPVA